ncbi:hypothetical protein IQ268_06660 [Oculatella sp. LEGE 06141]|uniref:hypothetical protein n=1 Tax=Oculatella sp. LEGE 06141 TaxID=1828648 RepID=UPI00187E2CE0|nr:hypothetical protein [Oculatella sp. LEGE 06141]MBE9178266.1 hypothetical protein [Oculatella sp. LEGE 06141]
MLNNRIVLKMARLGGDRARVNPTTVLQNSSWPPLQRATVRGVGKRQTLKRLGIRAIALSIPLAIGVISTAVAQVTIVPDQVARSTPPRLDVPRASERFFTEGRVQFERETQTLVEQQYTFSDSLLEIRADSSLQDILLPLEDPALQQYEMNEGNGDRTQ